MISNVSSVSPARKPGRLITVLAAFALSFGLVAVAAAEVSDEEIELFAEASIAVEDVNERYESKLEDADEAEQQELVTEMSEKMQTAVTDTGLTWERYEDIVFEAGSDEALNERIIQEIERQRD